MSMTLRELLEYRSSQASDDGVYEMALARINELEKQIKELRYLYDDEAVVQEEIDEINRDLDYEEEFGPR
jgi:formyltetrahydrofolate synthetase